MEAWAGITVADSAFDGDLTQLYPTWATVGVNPATATNGQQIRQPIEGIMYSLQVQTDLTNAGVIEIWDVNGADGGADVSSAAAITNAQLLVAISKGLAKLIYSQNFLATGITPPTTGPRAFQRGLAARFVGAAGDVKLNMAVTGGFRLTTKVG